MPHVNFATNEDSVNPELSSGFSGFPFVIKREEEIDSTVRHEYQIECSRSDLVIAYWQVKSWNVFGAATYTPLVGSPTTYPFDFIATIGDDNTPSTVTDETELCFHQPLNSSDDLESEDGGNVGIEMFEFTYSLPPHDADSLLRSRIVASVVQGIFPVFVSTKKAHLTDVASGLTASILVNETSIPLTFYQASSVTGAVSGTFDIESYELWGYAY